MPERMPEERLANARVVAQYLRHQLRETEQKIRELEKEAAEHKRRKDVAFVENRFRVEHTWDDETPDVMHRGGCGKNPTAGRLLQAEEAAIMMRDRPLVACKVCNPLPALRSVFLTVPLPDEGA
ncbi:DUF6233 domain-containing protein [Streptomyces fractus]|uniref:DUF6233 domain-containing protein n=1 Tax=Streptomyces fractus TaxID=641806 RepID=UPI003CF98685